MFKPRWRKIFRDLWRSKTRSALIVAVITVGVFSVASILTAYSVLIREMDASYLATNPASAVLYVNDASLLPTSPGVNPQGTIMAIARRNATHWADQWL